MKNNAQLNRTQKRQLFQFCLYGFLKNLQFFEPFLILVFLDRGFSFAAIGVLIAFRSICVNIMEIPSGAMADVYGKRRTMIASMLTYMASFILFAIATDYWMFFPAMFLFALGEAFRTGTHKAMIFQWLTHEKYQDEKTRIYGLTRSWSKQGSAINCIIAALVLILTGNYRIIFLITLIPLLANLINISLYPKYLDGNNKTKQKNPIRTTLANGLNLAFKKRKLRNLILENVYFEGIFSVTKDFLQPTLKAIAISAPVLLALSGETRTAILVAIVYMTLNQLSSIASRLSHKAVNAVGDENHLAKLLWILSLGLYILMGSGFLLGIGSISIIAFILLALTFNIWKSVFVSRFYDHADQDSTATTLSIANQGKSISIAILAPLLGYAIDLAAKHTNNNLALHSLWPVAITGGIAAILGLATNIIGSKRETCRRI